MTQEIQSKLDRLAEMQSQMDVINLHFDELRKSILTPEILAQLDELEAERKTAADVLSGGIASLTDEIKADVIQFGATVKSAHLQAVFAKGRVSWDTKALDGYAAAHPEIAAFRDIGKPSVSLRKV